MPTFLLTWKRVDTYTTSRTVAAFDEEHAREIAKEIIPDENAWEHVDHAVKMEEVGRTSDTWWITEE